MSGLGFAKLDRRELAETIQEVGSVRLLHFVEEGDHGSTWPDMLQADDELRDGKPASFPFLTVFGSLVGAEHLPVAKNEVEDLVSMKLMWEEACSIWVVVRDAIPAHTHVFS